MWSSKGVQQLQESETTGLLWRPIFLEQGVEELVLRRLMGASAEQAKQWDLRQVELSR